MPLFCFAPTLTNSKNRHGFQKIANVFNNPHHYHCIFPVSPTCRQPQNGALARPSKIVNIALNYNYIPYRITEKIFFLWLRFFIRKKVVCLHR